MFKKNSLLKIMKKNIWIWALVATTLMTACSKNDDPVVEEPEKQVTEDDWVSPDGQVVIQLGGGDYNASANVGTVTRAPLTNSTFANGKTTVGIYAASTTGAWNTTGNLLLENRKALVTPEERNEADGADVSHTSTGTPAVTAPYKISLYDKVGTAAGCVEYYPMQATKNFTFYGYGPYLDSNTATTTANGATVTFKGFNGSQDIIWNKAEAKTIAAGAIYEKSGTPTTAAINGYNAKYIRMLKFHRELNSQNTLENYPWVPNICFTHQLTQLQFYVVPAEKQSTADKTAAGNMRVRNITIKAQGTPTLNILDGTLTASGTTADLKMMGIDASSNFTDDVSIDDLQPDANGKVAGYLMLIPANSYQLELTVVPPLAGSATGELDETNAQTVTLTLSNGNDGFVAGSSYNIKIGIYAMQQVEADASLTEWTDKGNVNIDVE